MSSLSYTSHRVPFAMIRHAVGLYFWFEPSYRDVEDLLAERSVDASYEAVRRWTLKFCRIPADRNRRRSPRPSDRWHLDKVFLKIGGKTVYLWLAVDDEVPGSLVQWKRGRKAALEITAQNAEAAGPRPEQQRQGSALAVWRRHMRSRLGQAPCHRPALEQLGGGRRSRDPTARAKATPFQVD